MTDVSDFIDVSDPAALENAVARAREVLADRRCVVLPTDTVYGIGADAFSPLAVAVLLAAKGRGRTMPPPVLIADRRVMAGLAYDVPEEAEALAERFWPGALTLILKSQPTLTWDLGETRGTVALRVPDDAVARELLYAVGPMAVSSANRTGMDAATTADAARSMLGESVALYLDAGPRESRDPSTIVDCTVTPFRVARQGSVPLEELRAVVPDLLAEGLGSFHGSSRRFDPKGEDGGVRVFDDYAHHPTEVAAALTAARDVAQGHRVLAVFQPHLYSRTREFAEAFCRALEIADLACVTDVFGAREEPQPGITGAAITGHASDDRVVSTPSAEEAIETVVARARPGDVIMTIGAGDVTALGPRILSALAQR